MTVEDLGKKVSNDEDTIEIEGDLAKKVIKIKATGTVAWGICIAAIAIAVASIIATAGTAGTAAPVAAIVSTPALAGTVSILGIPTTIAAISIAVAGGGVGTLNKLRDYRMEKISDKKIVLHKK